MKDAEKRTDFLTARQLAEILQIGESTVHRLRRQGRIPAILVTNRLIRFNLREVRSALGGGHRKHHEEEKETDQLSFEEVFDGFSREE